MDYFKEFPSAVTVCDKKGTIIYMNEKSSTTFSKDGGKSLIGKSLLDCHPETAREKIKELINTGKSNSYTIEKNGIKKLIHQSPWYEGSVLMGLIEISIEIPFRMEHFIRK
jgi:transcriptional regulator with PAS, ATPase and Fis domain